MSTLSLFSTIRRRHVVVWWWGNCSYRRLKVTYEVRKMLCPHCGHELEDGNYYGTEVFATDKNASDYVRDRWMPLLEDGLEVWVAHPEG